VAETAHGCQVSTVNICDIHLYINSYINWLVIPLKLSAKMGLGAGLDEVNVELSYGKYMYLQLPSDLIIL